jgi:hypothetical protein
LLVDIPIEGDVDKVLDQYYEETTRQAEENMQMVNSNRDAGQEYSKYLKFMCEIEDSYKINDDELSMLIAEYEANCWECYELCKSAREMIELSKESSRPLDDLLVTTDVLLGHLRKVPWWYQ